eukprot:1158233-Pelagomonas_calceolata.AAC.20
MREWQGPWGLPQPFHGASTPPRIPSSSSSATAAGPLSTQLPSDAHTRTIGFAVPASAPTSSAGEGCAEIHRLCCACQR